MYTLYGFINVSLFAFCAPRGRLGLIKNNPLLSDSWFLSQLSTANFRSDTESGMVVALSMGVESNSIEAKGKETTMEKKAIAYTSDIMLGNTGEIIERAFQRKRIEEYAKENDIKVVAWFEDETYNENLFSRPKIKELVAYTESYDLVLVERTWAISRKWKEVRSLMRVLENKKARMEATTTLWDCISQMARNYYRPLRHAGELPACALEAEEGTPTSINLVETYGRAAAKNEGRYVNVVVEPNRSKVKVRRPSQLAFERMR
jgi:hypothetical protein